MRFLFTLLMQCKRIAGRKSALISFAFLPLLVLLLGLYLPRGDSTDVIRAGVWLPAGSVGADELWRALDRHVNLSGYPLEFIPAESRERLENQVAAGVWECGYILPGDFRQRLRDDERRGLITLVVSPATSLASLINEAVSGAILDICAPDLALSYMKQSGMLQAGAETGVPPRLDTTDPADTAPRFDAFLEDLISLHFGSAILMKPDIEYLNRPAGASGSTAGPAGPANPTITALLRGFVALYLFLYSCLCTLWFIEDRRSGFYRRLAPYVKPGALYLPYYCAAALFAGADALLAIQLAARYFPGFSAGLAAETLALFLYLAYLAAVSSLLAGLFLRREPLAAALPFLLVACLLFCPILFDLSLFFPALSRPSALLPPSFYLRAAALSAAGPSRLPLALPGLAFPLAVTVVLAALVHYLRAD